MDDAAVLIPSYTPKDYKSDVSPIWCPGCGHFGIQASMNRAFAELGLPPEEMVVVSGIGCSSRLPAYTTCYGFHGLHGRALAVAAGVKLARPELTVIAVGGDGDGFSIGGNHFLHACRRNVDMTYIVMDNEVYGMTKGQPSPTTPPNWDSALSPGGTGISQFRPMGLALAAGARFIARGFSGDPIGLARIICEGIQTPGFSFIHVLSPCITYRPEEREWRKLVHAAEDGPTSSRDEAGRRAMADDGLTTGVLFVGDSPPYGHAVGPQTSGLAEIEREFML